jgi:tetraacyldisaccharide 4'-kinase
MTGLNGAVRTDVKSGISTIFLFTGIANPYPLEEHLKTLCLQLEIFRFADHHTYSVNDIQKILNKFDAHLSTNKILVTTEKDMMRLQSPDIAQMLTDYPVCYVPVEVVPDKHDKDSFNKLILDYVRKNQRNR